MTFLPKLRNGWRIAGLALVLLAIAGCDHHKKVAVAPPPNELAPYLKPTYVPPPSAPTKTARIPITPAPPGGVSAADLDFVATHAPILTEEGFATWYTAPYVGRKSANGQVFDDDALTAAHRTLPMGSLVVVTNLKTGQSAAMTITDRGPFVDGRILDLTKAAARATGVYRVGLAEVRLDVYRTPKPIDTGGRWCVQIGAFHSERDALKLKEQLIRKYAAASVIEFPGEKSFWVRIRPEGDNRETAEHIVQNLRPSEGEAYLTRLD
jgi:rare lipoprotein A